MNINETAHDYMLAFLQIVFKRKKLVLFFFTTVFLTVCIYTYAATPIYEASTELLVKIGRENIFVPQNANFTPVLNENSIEQINSEIEMLKSRVLAEKVLLSIGAERVYPAIAKSGWYKQFKSYLAGKKNVTFFEIAILTFQNNIAIQSIKDSRVIRISFQHADPKMAAEVVNKYSAVYLDARLQIHQDSRSFVFFDEQTKILRDKIQKAEGDLKELKSNSDFVELSQERSLLLQQKSDLQASLNDTESRMEETNRRLAQLKQQVAIVPERIPQGEETESNQLLINTLQAQLVQLELRKKELLNKYTDSNRLVREVNDQIVGVQQRLSDEESRRYGRSRYGPNPSFQAIRDELFRTEVEARALSGKLKTQQEHMEQYKKRIDKLSDNEAKLKNIQDDLEINRRNYQLYLSKAEESRISNEMDSRKMDSVRIIKPALPPIEASKPNKMLNLVLGFALSIFGGLGLALLIEAFRDHLERPEEVEAALGVPVLASIPYQHIQSGKK